MTGTIFLILAIISAWWGIMSSIMIVSFLKKRGIKINYFLLRILMLKYIHQYHQITRQETGKTGPWFYSYIIAMLLALVFVVIGTVFLSV